MNPRNRPFLAVALAICFGANAWPLSSSSRLTSIDDPTWRVASREDDSLAMRAVFGKQGVAIGADGDSEPIELELVGWSRGGEVEILPASFRHESGRRLEYGRGSLVEWYIHDQSCLRQGFTLSRAPIASQGNSLTLILKARGACAMDLGKDERSALLRSPEGLVLSYGGLAAWDASGRELGARLRAGEGVLFIDVEDEGAQYPLTIDPLILLESAKLTASDAGSNDQLGTSVALHAGRILTGAPQDDSLRGSAYVFQGSGSTWIQEAKLLASDGLSFDRFGESVALDGTTAIVGAYLDDVLAGAGGGVDAGSAYAFTRSGTVWTQQQRFSSADILAMDWFGYDVDLDGDTALVGARLADAGASESGAAYVFLRSGTAWAQQAKLVPFDPQAGNAFGTNVALDSNTVAIGCDDCDGSATNGGAVYVYVRSGTVWSFQQKLSPSVGQTNQNFGQSVDVEGDTIAVGASGGAPSILGSAYVFTRSGTIWTEQAHFASHDNADGDSFGRSIALSGDRIIVGAYLEDDGGVSAGAAYAFQQIGSSWIEVAKLATSDLASQDRLGISSALEGDTAAIGANLDTGAVSLQGSVAVFTLPDASIFSYCTAKTTSAGCLPFMSWSGIPSATIGPFQLFSDNHLEGDPGILLYSFKKASLGFHGGTLCVKSPFHRLSTLIKATDGVPCIGCAGNCRMFKRNFNAWIQTGSDPMLTCGQRVYAQYRQRDSADPLGFGDNLSDAVSFLIGP